MRARGLARLVAATVWTAGTLVVFAAPASAGNTCPSSDPLVVSASGTVRSGDPDWYRLTTTTRTAVTMVPTSGDPDMKIVGETCTPVFCYPYSGGTETCVLQPGTYNVGLLYFSGPGGVAGYSVTVADGDCVDGVDNDSDGRVDYPDDPGCSSYGDDTEGVPCSTTNGQEVCVGVSTSGTVVRQGVREVRVVDGPTHEVAGYVDAYRFTLPGGIVVTLPCVVLVVDGTTHDPCARASGVFVERISILVDDLVVKEPKVELGEEIAWAGVCRAEIEATVNGFGVNSFGGYTVCGGFSTDPDGPRA